MADDLYRRYTGPYYKRWEGINGEPADKDRAIELDPIAQQLIQNCFNRLRMNNAPMQHGWYEAEDGSRVDVHVVGGNRYQQPVVTSWIRTAPPPAPSKRRVRQVIPSLLQNPPMVPGLYLVLGTWVLEPNPDIRVSGTLLGSAGTWRLFTKDASILDGDYYASECTITTEDPVNPTYVTSLVRHEVDGVPQITLCGYGAQPLHNVTDQLGDERSSTHFSFYSDGLLTLTTESNAYQYTSGEWVGISTDATGWCSAKAQTYLNKEGTLFMGTPPLVNGTFVSDGHTFYTIAPGGITESIYETQDYLGLDDVWDGIFGDPSGRTFTSADPVTVGYTMPNRTEPFAVVQSWTGTGESIYTPTGGPPWIGTLDWVDTQTITYSDDVALYRNHDIQFSCWSDRTPTVSYGGTGIPYNNVDTHIYDMEVSFWKENASNSGLYALGVGGSCRLNICITDPSCAAPTLDLTATDVFKVYGEIVGTELKSTDERYAAGFVISPVTADECCVFVVYDEDAYTGEDRNYEVYGIYRNVITELTALLESVTTMDALMEYAVNPDPYGAEYDPLIAMRGLANSARLVGAEPPYPGPETVIEFDT